MSWYDITPAKRKTIGPDVCLVFSTKSQRFTPCWRIYVNAENLGIGWMRKDAMVRVQMGGGEHLGKLRIMPGGPVRVAKLGGRGNFVDMRIPALVKQPSADDGSYPVSFEVGDNWLELTLPEQTRARLSEAAARMNQGVAPISAPTAAPPRPAPVTVSPAAAAAPVRPTQEPASKGFSMLGGSVPATGRR